MQLQPWTIASWPIIRRSSQAESAIAAELQHLGTVVSGDRDEFGRLLGHTIWGAADLQIGLAWDWTETLDGVYAMSDPMHVSSNIYFVDTGGVVLREALTAVCLNRITHALPWQLEVSKATSATPISKRRRQQSMSPGASKFRSSGLGALSS
jgi:hypothetical protein